MEKEEFEALKKYLKLELLRNNDVITSEELNEIKELSKYESVSKLEDAYNKFINNEMSEEEYDSIHDYYRLGISDWDDDKKRIYYDKELFELLEKEILSYD